MSLSIGRGKKDASLVKVARSLYYAPSQTSGVVYVNAEKRKKDFSMTRIEVKGLFSTYTLYEVGRRQTTWGENSLFGYVIEWAELVQVKRRRRDASHMLLVYQVALSQRKFFRRTNRRSWKDGMKKRVFAYVILYLLLYFTTVRLDR